MDGLLLIDSHAHLEMDPLDRDVAAVLSRAHANGVAAVITVGIDVSDAAKAIELTEKYREVFASVGIHPHNTEGITDSELSQIEAIAAKSKVVGFGEIGLDYFRNWSPREDQLRIFQDQIDLAKRLAKPVVIHLRDAYPEGLGMLEKAGPFPNRGVIHCFSGTLDDARRALDLGFCISIPGTVTYKKNEILRGIVKQLPLDRIMLETDCPFLSPEPLRGKDNEPSYIIHTARKIAEIYGLSIQEIGRQTSKNTANLFALPLSQIETMDLT